MVHGCGVCARVHVRCVSFVQCQNLLFHNKLLRSEVAEKMAAERYLQAEVEASRLHLQDNEKTAKAAKAVEEESNM